MKKFSIFNFQFSKLKLLKKQAGFTLLELIIVISLSVGVFVLASGVFVQALKIQRRAFFIQKVQENISLALETMAREIRVSTIVTADTPGCPASPVNTLSMVHPVNGSVDYFLSGTDLHRRLVGNGVDMILNSVGTKISKLGFCISGNAPDDDSQPRVSILLQVTNGHANPEYNITIDMQTTVSQRLLSD